MSSAGGEDIVRRAPGWLAGVSQRGSVLAGPVLSSDVPPCSSPQKGVAAGLGG